MQKRLNVPKRYFGILLGLSVLVFVVVFYGTFLEPRLISVKEVDFQKTLTGLKIAVLSDIHVGPYKRTEFIHKIVTSVEKLNPDLVLLVGDFVYGVDRNSSALFELKELGSKYPCFAVLGNHDYRIIEDTYASDPKQAERVRNLLEEMGINVLKDNRVLLNVKDNKFWLLGLDEYWYEGSTPEKAFMDLPSDGFPRLVLAHNPNMIDKIEKFDFDLMLSGHTHGGQIRLPFVGHIYPLPTHLGWKYDEGLFKIKNHDVFITSGIGESGPRARLFNPPEIIVLNF